MSNITLNINLNLRSILVLSGLVLSSIFLFNSKNLHAQSTTTLSGSYGCAFSKNFAGFMTRNTGAGSTFHANGLGIVTINGSTATLKAVGHEINNFEQSNASMAVSWMPATDATIAPDTTIAGMYKLTGPSGEITYIVPVNNGNTLMLLSIKTDQGYENQICQKI